MNRLLKSLLIGSFLATITMQAQNASPGPANQDSDQPAKEATPLNNSGVKNAVAAQPGFFKRLAAAYKNDWFPPASPAATDPESTEPPYRGYPPPESNPPYPFTVWPMGGTPWIGYPSATQYPLTTALQTGPNGEWWKKANVQIYGWVDVGMDISTSHNGPYGNAPAAYPQIPNSFILDQATLYFERVPDTIQTDHFDWGFRFTNLYGFDYRFTTAEGYFSQQLLDNPQKKGR